MLQVLSDCRGGTKERENMQYNNQKYRHLEQLLMSQKTLKAYLPKLKKR